jgi:hypothetical protein
MRLIGLQRKLLVARKELAAKLKDSVQEPTSSTITTTNKAVPINSRERFTGAMECH